MVRVILYHAPFNLIFLQVFEFIAEWIYNITG